jgi:transcriptional regulator with XRE-family HTH domain
MIKFPNQRDFFVSCRHQQNIQFNHLAQNCGISAQQVNAWTKGKAPIPGKYIRKIALYLRVSPLLIVDIMARDFKEGVYKDAKIA